MQVKIVGSGVLSLVLMLSVLGGVPVSAESDAEKKVLIVFEEQVDEAQMEEIVDEAGGTLSEEYEEVDVASAEMTASSIDELLQDPAVKYVEEDSIVRLHAQMEDWGIQETNTPQAWNSGLTGEGVKIAVLDSGIAQHEDLAIAGGVSTVAYTSSYADDQGHGTHVAGIIGARNNNVGVKGVAYEAELYAIKAFNEKGSAYLSDMIEGIDWSIANDMDIVNMSAGTQSDSAAFRAVVDKAYAAGLILVAAAGNDGAPDGLTDTVDFPARYSAVIGVGAVDSSSRRATFSSTGPDVEVAAPGVNILSTYTGGQYAYMSGTSMATPYVAGQLALLKQAYPELSNEELRMVLTDHARDLGQAGRDPFFGYGLIQASSFTETVEFEESNPLSRINLGVKSVIGAPGESKQVSASAVYENGETRDITSEASWSTANRTVATVSGGKVNLVGYGTTTIKVTYEGQTAVLVVEVPEPAPQQAPVSNPIVKFEINPPTSLIGEPGETLRATAFVAYENGEVKDVTSLASWSSANTEIAEVSGGTIKLKNYGSTTITATYEGKSTMLLVNSPEPSSEPMPVVDVTTSVSTLTGNPGQERGVTASAVYGNGEVQNITNEARWSSSNQSVATVSKGIVELKSQGTASITVTFAGESATVKINVSASEQGKIDFNDVPTFYAPAVDYLVQRGITQGKSSTEFGVTDNIIRADAAIWLAKELGLNTATASASGFGDVPDRAAGAVNALKQAGIIGGKTASRFGSYDPLTRGEVAIILQRAYDLDAGNKTSAFTDVSSRYADAVNALVANEVTDGITSTKFGVSSNITRGQLAVFIYRLAN